MNSVVSVEERAGRVAREGVQARWRSGEAPLRHVDFASLVVALGLSAFGMVVISSATLHRLRAAGLPADTYVTRQAIALGIGLAVLVCLMAVDYRRLRTWAPVCYLAALALLGVVLSHGTVVNASRSWLVFGPIQLQPSELAKPALIVALAAVCAGERRHHMRMRTLLVTLGLAAAPMGLILFQPDLGTFAVFVAMVFAVLLLGRLRVRYLVVLSALGVAAVVGAVRLGVVQDYQVARVTAFLTPELADAQAGGWNVAQAQIAVGSGQLAGRGLFQGTQTALSFVPENHTDFIFTVVGEETGFIGSALTLAAYGLLVWRGLRIAGAARDAFGTLLAGGVVAVLAFQVFVNVGMAIGIMPVTGLPLPFVSYGGTSLVASFALIGLLQSVHMRRFR